GQESVVVGNFSNEMVGVYRHLGGGLFLDRAAASKIGYPSLKTLTFGLFLFDVELDGDLDLFAANGHVLTHIAQTQEGIAFRQSPHLFLNDGEGHFHDVAPEIGGPLAVPLVGRGASWGDYDRDGDTDVLVTENGGGAHLFRNETTGRGGVLRVRLRGRGGEGSPTGSQRQGLSSRVEAVLPGGARVSARVRTGSSYLSQSETVAVLGLGSAEAVDTLVVHWSGGGEERVVGVGVDQEVVVEEGRGVVEETLLPVPLEQTASLSVNH
ncbi:MAG: CRTAC1 family protein, partial [Rhodothermales bacterium]